MALRLRGLLDGRIVSIFVGLHDDLVLVADPGSGIQAQILLLVVGGAAWTTGGSLSCCFQLSGRLWIMVLSRGTLETLSCNLNGPSPGSVEVVVGTLQPIFGSQLHGWSVRFRVLDLGGIG